LDAVVAAENQTVPVDGYSCAGGGLGDNAEVLQVRPLSDRRRCGWAAVGRTPADRPIVAAVAVVETEAGKVSGARLALTGVWQQSLGMAEAAQRLVGTSLDEKTIEQVAAAVGEEVSPGSNYLASDTYRRAMAVVLTRRALADCQKGGDR